jgi:hypothetical protein
MLATTRATTLRVFKAHHFLAAGLAGLALTAAVAAGTWQMSGDSTGPASMAPRAAVAATVDREPTHTFYLVASQAWAAKVQTENDMAAEIRVRDGDFGAPDVAYVEVVNDAASLDRVMRNFTYLNTVRFTNGLSEVTLVDLRGLGR